MHNLFGGEDLKIYRKILYTLILALSAVITGLVLGNVFGNKPGDILLFSGEEQSFSLSMPYGLKIDSGDIYVSNGQGEKIPADQITINLGDEFNLEAADTGNYEAKVYLFNLIPVDTISVNVVTPESVYVGGNIIGLALNTDGILVLGSGSVTLDNGTKVSPAENILRSGDYIVEMNGERVTDKAQFVSLVQKNGDKTIELKVRRNEEEIMVSIKPVMASDNSYKIGAWIRDDTAGVGTITYYSPESGVFGTLGHGITDVDTGTLLSISSGEVYRAHVLSIEKGEEGEPGEIVGSMSRSNTDYVGAITENTTVGVFGKNENTEEVTKKFGFTNDDLYQVGSSYSVTKGSAYIVSCMLGEKEYYSVEITEVSYGNTSVEKSIKLKITDERLIEKTGGIIQGMSGSPIIQNGKLVGAVTHVTVDNPKEGYGIFIENMLDVSG